MGLYVSIFIYIYVCEHIYIYMITHENTKLLQKIESHSGRYGKCVPMMQHQMINGGCQWLIYEDGRLIWCMIMERDLYLPNLLDLHPAKLESQNRKIISSICMVVHHFSLTRYISDSSNCWSKSPWIFESKRSRPQGCPSIAIISAHHWVSTYKKHIYFFGAPCATEEDSKTPAFWSIAQWFRV